MSRQLCSVGLALLFALPMCQISHAAFVNGNGDLYPGSLVIPQSPIPPADGTGWNGTSDRVGGSHGVEALTGGAPLSAPVRLAFGSTNVNIPSEDAILFQDTQIIANTGDIYSLDWFGRGYFNYDQGSDFQTSFFGYIDGSSNLVQVETKQHPQILDDSQGGWTAASHQFTVPALMNGESLVVGFFTATGGATGGGFTSVDDVSLTLVPEPATGLIALFGTCIGLGIARSRRKQSAAGR